MRTKRINLILHLIFNIIFDGCFFLLVLLIFGLKTSLSYILVFLIGNFILDLLSHHKRSFCWTNRGGLIFTLCQLLIGEPYIK